MSEAKYVLVKHIHHDGPWLLPKSRAEVRLRIAQINEYKALDERPIRLKLLKIVKEPLPPQLEKALAARQKVYAAWEEAYAAWQKTNAAWLEADAALGETDAALKEADAALEEADAALEEADAAWEKAIVSEAGIAFHKKVCGCGLTLE